MHDSLKVVVERMPLGHGSMIEDEFVHPQVRVVVKDDGQAVEKGQVRVVAVTVFARRASS